ncbi:tetratricopeptide repeat protein [Citromicrobium bathyomarinum]|uniref:tetratricopeptide repeat protein n=1 Tax=Citromicrobium bathyomarinum TaxID=72174 RepID=UPI001E28D1D9|nr:tetratricopeptide repeat protein [Citromicrobium bathyomarinum]MCD1623582.1 tetratricopeptide repeat protein [Citromicrobium bathyomarinum]
MILAKAPARKRLAIYGALAGLLLTSGVPAMAQDNDSSRIRKLEAEIRALQRRVFPGGDGRYFEPEISGPANSGPNASTQTTAVTDILARLDALEASIQSLTRQVEVATNTQTGIEQRLAVLENATATGGAPAALLPAGNAGASNTGTAATTTTRPAATTPTPTPAAATGPSAERLAAVRAIAKPQTDDAGDDDYSYGFRLWEAGFYPEAQQALAAFVEKYPDHWRTTYGRNLLGRAFLDNGQAREAAPWFLKNYQADNDAARAPDSLLYLAESMIELGDTNRACIALAEFSETYPALATGRLSDQYQASRRKVSCS